MKFANLFAVSMAVLPVFGASLPVEKNELVARDSETVIAGAIKNVTIAVKAVDAATLTVNSTDVGPLLDVYNAAQTLAGVLADSQATVQAADSLSYGCALRVQKVVEKLIHAVQKLSKDIIAIRSFVYEDGVQSLVLSTLQQQQAAADSFADALAAKVPDNLKKLAAQDKTKVDRALNKAIAAYSDP